MIEARFDDGTGEEPSFRLVGPAGVVEAVTADEVPGVLDAAEAASARGLWVAGYVAYEAAPGLDPALTVRARDPSDPFATAPLAWFAMFEGRQETTLPEPPAGTPVTLPRQSPALMAVIGIAESADSTSTSPVMSNL